MKEVTCKKQCGFEDEFEPDEFGITYFQSIGECPNCNAPTIYSSGEETKTNIIFTVSHEKKTAN